MHALVNMMKGECDEQQEDPLNTRIKKLDSHRIRMLLISQTLHAKALRRENEKLKKKIATLESSHKRVSRFLNKLSYALEVILNLIRNPFWRNKK